MTYILYKTTNCAWCPAVKKFLERKGIPHTDVVVDGDFETMNWLHKLTNMTTVPVLVKYDGETVVGFAVGYNAGKITELIS